jgi:hypothetical protein
LADSRFGVSFMETFDAENMPLLDLLNRSAASDSFRAAMHEFLRTAQPVTNLDFDRRSPPVKVERTLSKLLESYPDLPIEQVIVDGTSGCEFYRGIITVVAAGQTLRVRFDWNCRWKAEQLGWTDWFGLPDQARAAREFGHDCFRVWEEEPVATPTAA